MSNDIPADAMRAAAARLIDALPDAARDLAVRPFGEEKARRWIEYRPERRPGACVADLDRVARKAAHRLLATGLSFPAYAQAMSVIALEEVLDRKEGWQRGRHSNDYWVVVFGDPGGDAPWSWRFEGHHLSVSMTVAGDEVSPTPVFLGANPMSVTHFGVPVLRPLGLEQDIALALLDAMGPAARGAAIVSDAAPTDIRSSVLPRAPAGIEPLGVAAARLNPAPRALLEQLLALYLSRLPDPLAQGLSQGIDRDSLFFAWEGPAQPGQRHYYRLQAPDLLIEYDNTTDDGSHPHTVLRRPASDFGDDVLARHHAEAHG
jgi:hypothetical protein